MANQATIECIAAMMKQNVGSSILDSGGTPRYDEKGNYAGSEHGYGRHFERNRNIDLMAQPKGELSFRVYQNRNSDESRLEVMATHNVFHWLCEKVELDEEMDGVFHGTFREENDPDDDKCWLELVELFPEWLSEHLGEEVGGIYGEGKPITNNTYNGNDMLSQTLQYVFFSMDREEYVILQIHGGADVRGGYSTPHIFRLTDELSIMDNARGTIYCTGEGHHPSAKSLKEVQDSQLTIEGAEPTTTDFDGHREHYWYTDDGCNWYPEGTCGGGRINLEDMPCKELDEDDNEWEEGVVCVDSDIKEAYCPHCGAKLALSY